MSLLLVLVSAAALDGNRSLQYAGTIAAVWDPLMSHALMHDSFYEDGQELMKQTPRIHYSLQTVMTRL